MLLVLPFGTFLVDCSSEENTASTSTNPTLPDTTPPDAPPVVVGANIVFTSSKTNAHSHSFSIPSADFTSPPAAGITGATTAAQLHSHLLAVTEADLMNAQSGQTVKVVTTSELDHTHTFTIVRVVRVG
jgi:hypothetical protein